MGFIREQIKTKKGKKYHYFHYCIRRRSRIKDGGNGKILCPDRLIGYHPILGKYLAFHLWDGLNPVDYAEALIDFEIKRHSSLTPYLKWEVEWKLRKGKPTAGKVKIRAVVKDGLTIDARASYPRTVRKCLQNCIDEIIRIQDSISDDIEAIAANLARHQRFNGFKESYQADYREWKADPYREWEDDDCMWRYAKGYGDRCLEHIEIAQSYADRCLANYQDSISDLLEDCPPGDRERFKASIIHQTERLAAHPTFLDRYDAK